GTKELNHSSLCRWSQSPPLPERSERDCRGSGGRPIRRSRSFAGTPCSLRDIADALNVRCHSPLELLAAHDAVQSRAGNGSSKFRVEWSASKESGNSRNGNACRPGAMLEAS